jgi:hypothetical protein
MQYPHSSRLFHSYAKLDLPQLILSTLCIFQPSLHARTNGFLKMAGDTALSRLNGIDLVTELNLLCLSRRWPYLAQYIPDYLRVQTTRSVKSSETS